MKVIIFKCGEKLHPGEEMIGTKNITLPDGNIGIVALIKNFDTDDFLDIRIGELEVEEREVLLNKRNV